jgi:hypothetical protein
MYRKISGLLLALACVSALSSCKKDAQIDGVMTELNSFTQELVKKVEGAANPSTGIDEAQALLDSRKADMKEKIDSIKGLRGYQVSEETKKKMMESITEDVMSVNKLKIKYMTNTMRDPALKSKLDKLVNDYNALLKM